MSVTSSSDHSNQEREVWLVVRTIGAWPGRARAGAEFYHQVWFSQQAAATKSHKKRGVVGCGQAVSRHKSPSFYLHTRIPELNIKMKVAILLLSVVVLSQAESWVAAPYTLVKRGTTLGINVVDIYLLISTVLY